MAQYAGMTPKKWYTIAGMSSTLQKRVAQYGRNHWYTMLRNWWYSMTGIVTCISEIKSFKEKSNLKYCVLRNPPAHMADAQRFRRAGVSV